jgi:integration host factor subunit beta
MSDTITKKDLIDRICEQTGHKRAAVRDTVQTFLDMVISELAKGHRLEFRDFGVFEIKSRAPRKAQNPKTLEPVQVPARRTVKFKVGRLMREALDSPPPPGPGTGPGTTGERRDVPGPKKPGPRMGPGPQNNNGQAGHEKGAA